MTQSNKADEIQLLTLAEPYQCSYLPDQLSNSVFLGKGYEPSWQQYSELSRMGFRRSGDHYYRPNCPSCSKCMSSRIICKEINLNTKSFKRIKGKAKDFIASIERPVFSSTHYSLYEKYINSRHSDGDMHPASIDQYKNFLLIQTDFSRLFVIRDKRGNIISTTLIDILDDGVSAIYTYFDPEQDHLSPGTLAILMLCQYALNNQLPYVYLGYWVEGSRKMEYKKRFKPLEVYNGQFWQKLEL